MGLFDSLWVLSDLADIAKDFVMLPFEIGKAATELGQDIEEAVVQDVKNKVSGTPNAPIRTSYTIRDEAEALIKKSQDDFWEATEKFDFQWKRMIRKAEKVQKARTDIYALIGQAVHSKKLPRLPTGSPTTLSPPSTPSIDNLKFDFGTYFGSKSMRMEAAEEFLSKAKLYRAAVKSRIAEVNQLKRLVMNASHSQKEELEMLSAIQKAYQRKSEAKLIKSAELLCEIAGLCVSEVSEHTNAAYDQLLKKLKKLWV